MDTPARTQAATPVGTQAPTLVGIRVLIPAVTAVTEAGMEVGTRASIVVEEVRCIITVTAALRNTEVTEAHIQAAADSG